MEEIDYKKEKPLFNNDIKANAMSKFMAIMMFYAYLCPNIN